jgi:hypothetical protein
MTKIISIFLSLILPAVYAADVVIGRIGQTITWSANPGGNFVAQFGTSSPITIYAMECTNAYSYATISDLLNIGAKDFTISLWLYPKAWNIGTDDAAVIFRLDNIYPTFQVHPPAVGGALYYLDDVQAVSHTAPAVSNWTHIVVSYSSVSGKLLYYNGVPVATNSSTSTKTLTSGLVFLFQCQSGTPRAPAAMMCEFAVWTNSLSQSDVSALYSTTNIPAANLSVSPWNNGYLRCALHLTNSTGTSDTDITGHGFDATLGNGMTWGSATR